MGSSRGGFGDPKWDRIRGNDLKLGQGRLRVGNLGKSLLERVARVAMGGLEWPPLEVSKKFLLWNSVRGSGTAWTW